MLTERIFPVKLLGVFVDYELTFSEHVNYICKCTSRNSQIIKVPKKRLSNDTMFHAFVSSNFNYCPTTWHFTSKSSTMKREEVHKTALRVVYNDYTTSYSGLLDMSNRAPLFLTRLKGLLIEVFKCIRGFHQPRLVIRTFHHQGRCSRGGHLCNEHSEEKYSCSYK